MSPFLSKAQHRKFYQLAKEKKVPMSTVHAWEAHTKSISKLPERVRKKKINKKG